MNHPCSFYVPFEGLNWNKHPLFRRTLTGIFAKYYRMMEKASRTINSKKKQIFQTLVLIYRIKNSVGNEDEYISFFKKGKLMEFSNPIESKDPFKLTLISQSWTTTIKLTWDYKFWVLYTFANKKSLTEKIQNLLWPPTLTNAPLWRVTILVTPRGLLRIIIVCFLIRIITVCSSLRIYYYCLVHVYSPAS